MGKLQQKSQLNRAIILIPRQNGCNSNDNHTKWTSVEDCELSNSGKLAGQAGEAVCTPAGEVLVSNSRVSAFQEVRDTMIMAKGGALPLNSGNLVADAQSDTVLSGSVGVSNVPMSWAVETTPMDPTESKVPAHVHSELVKIGNAVSNGCLVGDTFVDDFASWADQSAGVSDMDTENCIDKVLPHVHSE